MRPFFENRILERQVIKPLTLVIDTTKVGSASNTFILPIVVATGEIAKIYWGDGSNSVGVNGDNTHVYTTSGIYTVKVESKLFGGVVFSNVGDKAKVLNINTFGRGVIRILNNTCYGCSNLASVDDPTIISPSMDASFMFYRCYALTALPNLNLSRVTSTRRMCYQCTSLTTLPKVDLSKSANVNSMFYECTALTTIPLLDLSSVTDAVDMFFGVTLTTQSYSDFLVNLATLPLKNTVTFHGGNSKYNSAGAVARAYIISTFGWIITDGGVA